MSLLISCHFSTWLPVLGSISPNLLGRTLTHEHVALDFEHFYKPPPADFEQELQQKISMATLGYVRLYPYSSRENIRFCDQEALEASRKDVLLFKKHGGGAIVENSSYGLKRNLEFIVDLAKTTGVHFIAGTGHYIQATQDATHSQLSVEQMTDLYTRASKSMGAWLSAASSVRWPVFIPYKVCRC